MQFFTSYCRYLYTTFVNYHFLARAILIIQLYWIFNGSKITSKNVIIWLQNGGPFGFLKKLGKKHKTDQDDFFSPLAESGVPLSYIITLLLTI